MFQSGNHSKSNASSRSIDKFQQRSNQINRQQVKVKLSHLTNRALHIKFGLLEGDAGVCIQ